MSKKYFKLDENTAISALNHRAESVKRAAENILGITVPLVIFDSDIQVPPEHQLIEGYVEQTSFGVAVIPRQIKIHPRELTALADLTVDKFPDLPDRELLDKIDSQIWKFLVLTTIESPAQGREDMENLMGCVFSRAFNDWVANKYGVNLPNSK